MRALMIVLALCLPVQVSADTGYVDLSAHAQGWLNDVRSRQGGRALKVSPALTKAAAAHARDMATRGFYDHVGSDGGTVGDRVKRQGYRYCYVSENIYEGPKSLQSALEGWWNSRGHRKNMLSRKAREFGLVRGPGNMWVMVLGRSGC